MSIELVQYDQLNLAKWDACINRSSNGKIYASAAYLTSLYGAWDALVLGDYQVVMPILKKKKWRISYLYQPTFIQQTGIIGSSDPTTIQLFLDKAKSLFRFAEIHLNHENKIDKVKPRNNQIIDLHEPFADITKKYSIQTKRKLKQATKTAFEYSTIEAKQNIDQYKKLLQKKNIDIKADTFTKLLSFCMQFPQHAFSRGLFLKDELIASVTALKDQKRIYLISPFSSLRDRYPHAGHVLVNKLIEEFAEQPLLLDFEGSDIPGVFAFNKGFGAMNEPYYFYKWNDLPWPLNTLKR